MAKITLYNEQSVSVTAVPNVFIDEYMTQANGEYVKVYLYLLRSMNQTESSFSLAQIADHFDCTERDIQRALKYWEKHHLFRLEYDENRNLSGICFLTDQSGVSGDTSAPQKDLSNRFIQATAPSRRTYSPDDMKQFCEKDDIRELVFISEQYLGRTLTQSDLNTLFFWYDEFHLSAELIEFLIENSVAKGHTSLHYMQRIVEDFSARNVRTVEDARNLFNQDSALYHAVMKAFGIRGRNLVPSEINYLKKWSGKLGYTTDMIAEACNRTMRSIHEPSFEYANSIIEKWYSQNIKSMDEIQKADELYQQGQRTKRAKASVNAANRFINFKQRDNNYDELQAMLIQNSMQ